MKWHITYRVLRLASIFCGVSGQEGSGYSTCYDDGCQNGGACLLNVNDVYQCVCVGFSGSRCEVDIDECSYNYCLTPSICVNTPGSFHCDLTTAQTSIFPIPGSPVIEGCTGYTDLMNDPAVISDDDIAIQYQETRVIANDVFDDVEIREIPSVARETFTAEFPEEPEFWVESLMIKVGENVNLNVIFVTCTDQIDESTGNVTRNFDMTEYIKASTNIHYVDLSAVKDGKSMACACKIVLKTERLNIVADSSKFKVETYIDGCSLYQGELLADCQAHDLFSDLSMYGRTYVEWKPTPAAKQTLRSNGTGLVMHRLMYPSVTINDPMIVQSVTIIGNVYSANVTTDAYSLVGLKESDAPFLTVHLTLETVTTTSMVKVTPGLVDNGVDEILMKLEIMGCPLTVTTAQSTITTEILPTTDIIATTTEQTTSTTTPPLTSTSLSTPATQRQTSNSLTTITPVVSTADTASTEATTVTPANDSCCMIECTGPVLSKEEVDEKIVELERNLTISKRHTAKARRKNISANDERHSATAVGSCCGIVVLALVGSFIILMDIDHVIRAYYLLKAMLSKRVQSV